jgi:hypothetical protein
MSEEKRYQVLWLDDDFNPNRGENYEDMSEYKKNAETTCPIEITTCVTGDEFVNQAKDENCIWDAFIIDINVPKSEDDNDTTPQDIIADVFNGISSIVEQQRIPLFCFSGAPQVKGGTPGSSINGFLKDKGFSNNSKKKELYYYLKGDLSSLVKDLKLALERRNGQFKEHPEFEALFRIGDKNAKHFIEDLLKWEKDNSYLIDYANIRFLTEAIETKLYKKGFFGNSFPSLHTYIVQSHKDPNGNRYLNDVLNEKCRSRWEAASISFLSQYANKDHHPGKEMICNPSFQRMIFDAFVIFSRWYVRFIEDFKKSGYNMNAFTTTPTITNEGLIGNMIMVNGFWMVKDQNGTEYRIQDKNVQSQSWASNEQVTFSVRNQYKVFPVAVDIIRK